MSNRNSRNRKAKTSATMPFESEGLLTGNGDYKTIVRKLAKPVVKQVKKLINESKSHMQDAAASQFDRRLGLPQGTSRSVQKRISTLTGRGDYTIKTNSLVPNGTTMTLLPKFESSKRAVRVVEREYVSDIVSGALVNGSSVFTNTSFRVNPTNPLAFPWLCNIAQGYDQWVPNGIVYEFVSTSSEYNGVSQSLGSVILSSDYDVTDLTYATKQQMENADYACSAKPSEHMVHGLECDTSERPFRVLYTNPAAGTTLLFSTLANFQIATVGCSAAGVKLGELWVSYDISFYKKQMYDPTFNNQYAYSGYTIAPGDGKFGNDTSIFAYNCDFRLSATTYNYDTLNFPENTTSGLYLLVYTANSYNLLDSYTTLLSKCSMVQSRIPGGTTGDVNITFMYLISITGNRASIQFTNPKVVANSIVYWSVTAVNPLFRLS